VNRRERGFEVDESHARTRNGASIPERLGVVHNPIVPVQRLDPAPKQKTYTAFAGRPTVSSPPSRDSEFRYSTATLSWARNEHATLNEWSARKTNPHRIRTALLTRSLRRVLGRFGP
jgi:hypothetical protein